MNHFLVNHVTELAVLGAFTAGVIVGLLQWAALELLGWLYGRIKS